MQYGDLFDKIDVTKEGVVDWDKFASHMLLEFYEKDDRVKGATVPQWKNLKNLQRYVPLPESEPGQGTTNSRKLLVWTKKMSGPS